MNHHDHSSRENKCDFCCFRDRCDHKNCCFDHKDHCCPPFHINLGGLEGNLNFQLFRLKGCMVTIHFDCGGSSESITGRICSVGTDFVSLLEDIPGPSESKKVTTIMIQKICKLEWDKRCCSPCRKRDCDCHDSED